MRTLRISGSFHGPLSERMQPPSQLQVPPKNSGNSLCRRIKRAGEPTCIIYVHYYYKLQWYKRCRPGINHFQQLALVLVAEDLHQSRAQDVTARGCSSDQMLKRE